VETEPVKITIPFGERSTVLTLPKERVGRILQPGQLPPLANAAETLRQALSGEDARAAFARLTAAQRSGSDPVVAIAVNDYTRPTPLAGVLPVLLEILNSCGVADSRIRVVIALGTHRPMSRSEFRRQAGEAVLDRLGFINPTVDEPSSMIAVGRDPQLGEIRINRSFAEADMKVAVGTILPHGAVGFSGGAKIIIPGLASRDVVERFHERANADPENQAGRVDSPIRARIEKAVEPLGLDLLISLVVDPWENICGITAGHYVRAHRRAVEHAETLYALPFSGRSRVLVVGSAPADLDFWQAAKAIFNLQSAVEDDGWLVLLAPCPEGIPEEHRLFDRYIGLPPQRLEALLGLSGPPGLMVVGEDGPVDRVTLAPALALSRFRQRINIAVVSPGLSGQQVQRMGFHSFDSLEAALRSILDRMPEDQRRVDVATHGGMSYARVTGQGFGV
jgi:hypothetical protein